MFEFEVHICLIRKYLVLLIRDEIMIYNQYGYVVCAKGERSILDISNKTPNILLLRNTNTYFIRYYDIRMKLAVPKVLFANPRCWLVDGTFYSNLCILFKCFFH